jgi:hypothetical protein
MSKWAKSTARIAWAWALRNCVQVRPAAGCGIYSGGVQDSPDRGCGDAAAKSNQFAVEASVSPGRVLPRQLNDQITNGLRGDWSSWSTALGPAALDQLGVPAQQGAG